MENSTALKGAAPGISVDCIKAGRHSFIFVFVPVVYSCNFMVGVIGNSIVVAVIYRYMKLKTVANVFVLNLAISDLTFLVTLPMWATFTASGYQWLFGGFLCKASAGLVMFNLYSSVFFLTALSIDRYLAIVHPMRSRQCRTMVYAHITCVLVWLAALLLSLPTALTRDTMFITGHNITTCGILHPKLDYKSRPLLLTISLMKTILGFLVPFLIIITCYFLIGRALVGAQSVQGKESSRSRDDEVLRMLAAAIMAFFLCWMPHQAFRVYGELDENNNPDSALQGARASTGEGESDEEEEGGDITSVEFVEAETILDEDNGLEYQLPKHQRCACHLLNLISTADALKANGNPVYKRLSRSAFSKCSSLWSKSSRSTTAAEIIQDKCKLQLLRPNETRWNSLFFGIVRILKEQGAITAVCSALKIPMFTPVELAILAEYTKTMSPFAKALDVLQGEANVQMGWELQ
ncbi:hypothetical protein DPEC_G00080390 [Dallia pectoralis]|uniref:Uncharacterized protein n=1 Tax=Dallia pectoralis TaxID=75939 RepID=A0ACC2H512_DALPE|nr:hypothetical protein DPEC_G00080390 [Dallia pectoralis]